MSKAQHGGRKSKKARNSGRRWEDIRILIVSEDDQFRFWARQVLLNKRTGEVTSIAFSGDALHVLERAPVDLILLDLFGHPAGSINFIRELRGGATSGPPRAPVILVTKGGDEAFVREASTLGIENVIRKPVAEGELLLCVVSTLRDPRPVVWSDSFVGPDRRARRPAEYKGPERRGQKAAPSAQPAPTRSTSVTRLGVEETGYWSSALRSRELSVAPM